MVYRTAVVAALAAAALASPMKRDGAFSVTQIKGGAKVSGPQAYAKALAKYGQVVPSSLAKRVAQQSGSVEADPESADSQYLCPVQVGSQTLALDFDTGSSDLWVFSTELPSDQVNGQALYDTSTGSLEEGESWNIGYGDGSGASGNVYADTVVVGGVTATSQAVEAATSVSSSFISDSSSSGLLGLGMSFINTVTPNQQTTFFDTVKGSLAAPLFTADLKHQAAGSYDFGYIDSSKYTGDITYTPIDQSSGYWKFTQDGYSVGGSVTSESAASIADTGTSLLLISDDVVSAYYSQVSGASNNNGYSFPCDSYLPDFGIVIGGVTFTVPGANVVYSANGDGTCFGGVQSSDSIGFNILGDIFLKSQFVVFDSGNAQLGFAAQS